MRNFADKVAEELAKRGKNVLPPIFIVGGGKIGMPELGNLDQIYTFDENKVSEFVDKLLDKIPNELSLQFIELVLPTKAVDKAEHLTSGNVFLRYIELEEVRTGAKAKRWDALIRLPNNYTVVASKEQEHA